MVAIGLYALANPLETLVIHMGKATRSIWSSQTLKPGAATRHAPAGMRTRQASIQALLVFGIISASVMGPINGIIGMISIDLRPSIMHGYEPCFTYIADENLFRLSCKQLMWNDTYTNEHVISLKANEIFDGDCHGGSLGENTAVIDLAGMTDFLGFITINDDVLSFDQAPLIKNVHVVNGTTGDDGGFIVRKQQRFFVMDSCSSSGEISGSNSGGLCGRHSGCKHGKIKIVNSHSTGEIAGSHAAGITGNLLAEVNGTANITNCYATGHISGTMAGGISGGWTARQSGQVFIVRCYFTGNMFGGWRNGGIVGEVPAAFGGFVYIDQCYTTGEIRGDESGGIAGAVAATNEGVLHIRNCYSRGSINGSFAGGITGRNTGGQRAGSVQWPSGDVIISDSYASGKVIKGGGLIGGIHNEATGTIEVTHSVYNGTSNTAMIGGDNSQIAPNSTGNSGNLLDIQGRIPSAWSDTIWNATEQFPILKFQIELHRELEPRLASTVSPTPSASPSRTKALTPSETGRPTETATESLTSTKSPNPIITFSPSAIRTPKHERTEVPVQYPRRAVISTEL